MLRISESQQNAFTAQDIVIKAQTDIAKILAEHFTLASGKANRIAGILTKMKTALSTQPNQEAIAPLVKMILGSGSAFDTWLNGLAANSSSQIMQSMHPQTLIMIHMPKKINYADSDFHHQIESTWLMKRRAQSHGPDETTEIQNGKTQAAHAIEEFIRSEVVFLHTIGPAQIILNGYLNDSQVSQIDKQTIHAFSDALATQKAAYLALNLHELLNPSTQPLETVIQRVCEKYQSPAYAQYQNSLLKLSLLREPILNIETKYPSVGGLSTSLSTDLNQYVAPIFQRSVKYTDLLQKLQKEMSVAQLPDDLLTLVESTLTTAKSRAASIQGQEDVMTCLSDLPAGSSQRQEAALRGIAASESIDMTTYPEGPAQSSQIQHHRSTYLEMLLIEAFPNMFSQSSSGVLTVSNDRTQAADIYPALGLSLKTKPHDTIINPSTFDPVALDGLFERDHNPIWPFLKMIKPLDETFTLLHKVQAYKQVIQLVNEGRLKLDESPRIDQARLVAKNLLELVEKQIAKNPLEFTPVLTREMTTINTNIESSTLTKMGKKIAQSFSAQDRSAMPDEQKTVQRQYREFLTGAREKSGSPTSVADDGESAGLK